MLPLFDKACLTGLGKYKDKEESGKLRFHVFCFSHAQDNHGTLDLYTCIKRKERR